MNAWLVDIFGEAYAPAVFWIIVLILVAIVLWIVLRLARGGPGGTFISSGKGRQPRLAVTDATPVDNHRRLVLVRRDNVEHLILIGGPSDIVVESNIRTSGGAERPEPEFAPRAAPPRPAPPRRAPPAEPTPPRPAPQPRPAEPPRMPEAPVQIAEARRPEPHAETRAEPKPAPRPEPRSETGYEPRTAPAASPATDTARNEPEVSLAQAGIRAAPAVAASFVSSPQPELPSTPAMEHTSTPVEDSKPYAVASYEEEVVLDDLSDAIDAEARNINRSHEDTLEDEMSKLLEELGSDRKPGH